MQQSAQQTSQPKIQGEKPEKPTPKQPKTMTYQPYEKATIYRTAETLLVQVSQVQSRMNRKDKYVLGQEMYRNTLDLALAVSLAYMEITDIEKKIGHLTHAIEKTTLLLIQTRIAARRGLIHGIIHAEIVDNIVHVIKQAQGWIKSQKEKEKN